MEHLSWDFNWRLLIVPIVYLTVEACFIALPIALIVRRGVMRRLAGIESRLAPIESSLAFIEQHLAILVEQDRYRADG